MNAESNTTQAGIAAVSAAVLAWASPAVALDGAGQEADLPWLLGLPDGALFALSIGGCVLLSLLGLQLGRRWSSAPALGKRRAGYYTAAAGAALGVLAALLLADMKESYLYQAINALPPSAAGLPPAPRWASGRLLVQPRAGLADAEFEAALNGHGARSQGRIGSLEARIVEVPAGAEDALAEALSHHPGIEFAEKDMEVPPLLTPNDPYFGSAWHLAKIQSPAAWDSTTGAGVVVAILDSGVNGSHPDLSAQMVPGWNSVSGNADTADINGHGTAVAGTVAAATNNAAGVASVAWGAKLMPVRITNDSTGYAYWSNVASGLSWAADHGAKVANISYAVSGSSTVSSAAQYFQGRGGVTVVSAGNDGTNPGYADNPYMVTVSATDSSDAKASWSNYGPFVDVAAPGVSIATTTNSGGYGNWSGTSFSSPVAAGVVALIMNANPSLSPAQAVQVLEDSADKPSGLDFDPNYGHGRVNAAGAVQQAANAQAQDTQAPVAAIASPGGGATVQGLVAVSVSASDNVGVAQVALFAGSQQVAADSAAPFSFAWDSTLVPDGTLSLRAVAYDAANNQGSSALVPVAVDNVPNVVDTTPPSVAITNPGGGATLSGTVKVGAQASDDVGVVKVELYLDGALKAQSSSGSLSYSLNTKRMKAGNHVLRSQALDAAGNVASDSITVSVQ
jgi:subtilisin family serine protease